VVEETLEPGASVAKVALRHGVNANQVFQWRRLYRDGKLGTAPANAVKLLPVSVAEDEDLAESEPLAVIPLSAGAIHIDAGRDSDQPRRQRRSWPGVCRSEEPARMIALPAGTKIWIAAGVTDMRRGFHGLSAQVQTVLEQQPLSGHVFVFRGRRGDILKVLWFDGDGLCLLAKRLERGRFVWPHASSGTVCLSRAQLSMLLEGIDWRAPLRTAEQVMGV
jgi:transposase